MKRPIVAAALVLAWAALPASAPARPVIDSQTGRPMSCPDPSVVDARVGAYRYYLVCTSGYAANAFPIRGSDDLLRWHFIGYVFPAGRQPWWALPSPRGAYWGPAMYRIAGRWVVYFAAQCNHARVDPTVDGRPTGIWVIGVASARSLRGPWHTRLLHYRGQFNRKGGPDEDYGGVIDPSMVRDPASGQRYLFWAEQSTSIWVGRLSDNGLRLDPPIHQAMWARPGWEGATVSGRSVVEGPEESYRDGWFYLFYSGGSTWTGTYAVGVAVSAAPMSQVFDRISGSPVLASGVHWIGPGGTSAPVTGPDGRTYIFYHAETGAIPTHDSADRYLMLSPLEWVGLGGYYPLINGDGRAG